MAVLGIITCEVLEREFAYLLNYDPEVLAVTILEDQYSQQLIETVTRQAKHKPQRIASLAEYTPPAAAGLEVIVRVMKVGLHSIIKNLRNGVLGPSARWRPMSMPFCSVMAYAAMP
jgi:hypothetical protein